MFFGTRTAIFTGDSKGKMDIIGDFKSRLVGKALRVVLPEGRDGRIIAAARRLKDEDIAEPIVLGTDEQIAAAIKEAGVGLDGITVINNKTSDKIDSYAAKYVGDREDLSIGAARRMVSKPLFYGAMMVAGGDADIMVAGAASATASVISAGTLAVGMAQGCESVSSCFVMVVPKFLGGEDRIFIYADCAVNIDPTAEELADIAVASAASAKGILGEEPRVAMLSLSTKGSASSESVSKVREALEIARNRKPDLAIDGEFQADTAIIPSVAAKKVKGQSAVAGKANVLIFPDLDSGNIAYKLTQYMAGATAIGPLLQGFAKPIADLSRGASVDDIVSTTILTLVQLL